LLCLLAELFKVELWDDLESFSLLGSESFVVAARSNFIMTFGV
jgi:hypothetical protein